MHMHNIKNIHLNIMCTSNINRGNVINCKSYSPMILTKMIGKREMTQQD